jgi:hypothetical protein
VKMASAQEEAFSAIPLLHGAVRQKQHSVNSGGWYIESNEMKCGAPGPPRRRI